MRKPLIFVTNDDGVGALGLKHAIAVARQLGRVVVVAPEVSQSGMSHAITMYHPLYLRKVEQDTDYVMYACAGTPVDCVKIAFDYLLANDRPDLTISGINHGSNSAISVIYSGTMGAAIEASFYSRPSIGFSLLDHSPDADFRAAESYALKIASKVMQENIRYPICLNVNVPAVPMEDIQGVMVCRQNQGYWKETFEHRQDPHGRDYYWLSGDFFDAEPDSMDTDEWALRHNYVSVVPVQVDMTDHIQVKALTRWKF